MSKKERRNFWPKGFMEIAEHREYHHFSEFLNLSLQEAIETYKSVLRGDNPEFEQQELSPAVKQEGKNHVSQLQTLVPLLVEFYKNPGDFRQARQSISKEEGNFMSSWSAADSPPLERGQVQLRFYAQLGHTGETLEEAIRALSLRGKSAEAVSGQMRSELVVGRAVVNTVFVKRNERGRIDIAPQAGIQVSMGKDGLILVHGVKYVNGHPHLHEIDPPDSFTTQTYTSLFGLVVKLAGYVPRR